MWIRCNMMHENNTMSQHNSSYPKMSPSTPARADNTSWAIRFVVMLVLAIGSAAFAQPTTGAKESLDAYSLVDGWVRAWEVPAQDTGGIETSPMSAAIVTLRVDGRVMGRGASASLDQSPMLVWEAAQRAMDQANAKLTHEPDAMWDSFIRDLSSRVTITLELADVLVPISGSELELPGFGYTPGVMGVAVRRGKRVEILGTESMLSRHTDMTQGAMALSNSLASDGSAVLRKPSELAGVGYSFYRFEPVVLAQIGAGMGASFIDRGGRVVEGSEISMGSIASMSSNIAGHLMSRRWAGVERYGMMGTLDPVTGKSSSAFASPFEQAISAYALLRHGDMGVSSHNRKSRMSGTDVLRDLAVVEDGEIAPWEDKVGACMALIALSEIELVDILGDEELNTLRTKTIETLDGIYSDAKGFDEAVPVASHGLVAHALVRVAKLDPRDRTAIAQGALAHVFENTSAPSLAGQMPFLGWAQLELGGGQAGLSNSDSLIQMRDLVWEHQLGRRDLEWMDRDLVGGVVFTSSSTPLPSWLTMRPLAFLATMLGDERLTPGSASSGEIPIQIGRQIESIRFIHQLAAVDEVLHFYASGKAAKWGVRKALWDQRMPVEVDAMALLTLTETTRSFKEIMARGTP